jgi:bacteriocin-like protein
MQDVCELIELTECELDAVSGGNPFSINIAAVASAISATVNSTISNTAAGAQQNSVDNSVHISGP